MAWYVIVPAKKGQCVPKPADKASVCCGAQQQKSARRVAETATLSDAPMAPMPATLHEDSVIEKFPYFRQLPRSQFALFATGVTQIRCAPGRRYGDNVAAVGRPWNVEFGRRISGNEA
jgi:hypothetical protein